MFKSFIEEYTNNQLGLLLDSEIDLESRIENLRSVTAKQIQEVAQRYLPTSREDKKYVLLLRDPLKQ